MKKEDKEELAKFVDVVLRKDVEATRTDKSNYTRSKNQLKTAKRRLSSVKKKVSNNLNPFEKGYSAAKMASLSKELNDTLENVKKHKKKHDTLKDIVEDKVTISFNSVKIRTKKSYLKRIKNKSNYLEKRFENQIVRHIGKLQNGSEKDKDNAFSLAVLLDKTQPSHADMKSIFMVLDEVHEIPFNPYDEDVWGEDEDTETYEKYEIIVETDDTSVAINFV